MRDPILSSRLALRSISTGAAAMLIWQTQPFMHLNATSASIFALTASLGLLMCLPPRQSLAPVGGGTTRSSRDTIALDLHALVVRTDLQGKIRQVNDHFLALTGYQREEIIGRPVSVLHHPKDVAPHAEASHALATGDSWTGENRIVGRDGIILWTRATALSDTDADGRPCGTLLVHSDISRTKESLAAHNATASLNRLTEPVFMVSTTNYELTFANDAAAALFNWNREDMSVIRVGSLPLECDRPAVSRQIESLLAHEIGSFAFEALYKGVPYRADVQLIEHTDIRPRLYVVLRDQVAVKAAGRAKDELVATVSHELRTPLTSIKGALGLIRSGVAGELTDKIRDLLDIAYRNADRLVLIVNDILDLEKLAAGQMDYDMERQDLIQTLKEAIAANEAFATRFGVTIRLIAEDDSAFVCYDADRIHQVMTNLISNACKFSPTGTDIEVRVDSDEEKLHVSVTDKGIGIPADALETIFDRFTQVGKASRSRQGGTGLGLSIVKGIVESHGGTVDLSSIEGQGTTVTITLHRAPAEKPAAMLSANRGLH
ncbi:PAS/PAC sensor signal transduction histidine kinase [Loktanella atrilutea]|uniref:histidine kinase n=2 Tax=Loktanella atrilutea TaxID=366533 RepID=A0A1M5DCV7_LOKAT|nr:PAS/PAC sensor signal transduction histidine kinase [Loktanella atrilutea]